MGRIYDGLAMTIYYWHLGISIFLTVCSCAFQRIRAKEAALFLLRKKRSHWQAFFFNAAILALIIIPGIRDVTVGVDTYNYVYRYEVLGTTAWKDLFYQADAYSFEYGFAVFCKLLYVICPDYRFFLLIVAGITGVLTGKAIKRLSLVPMLSLLVYVCWGFWASSMNIIRQMMVIPLIYLAIDHAKKRDLEAFLELIIVAALFHEASIIFLAIYPLINKKVTVVTIVVSTVFSIIMGLGGYKILAVLLRNTSFGWYFGAPSSTSGLSTLILLIVVTLMCWLLKGEIRKYDDNIDIWLMILLAAMVSTSIGMHVRIFERLTKFFAFTFVFVYTDIYVIFKKKNLGFVALPMLIALLVFYYLFIIMRDPVSSSHVIPYITSIN